jgi:ArsR family transcriptional regulator
MEEPPVNDGPESDRTVGVLDVSDCCGPLCAADLTADAADRLAEGFKALGDPVRLKILSLLATAEGGEVCVCDLVEPLGKSQPTVSHHLRKLADAGLVSATRRGTNVWYAVVPAQLDALRGVLNT